MANMAFYEREAEREALARARGETFQPKPFVCEFCRAPRDKHTEESIARTKERAKRNDDDALHFLGAGYLFGLNGMAKDERKGLDLVRESYELGNAKAANTLATCYGNGYGVAYDRSKCLKFNKEAAERGYVLSRYNLGKMVWNDGDHEASMYHFRIAAAAGHKASLDYVQTFGFPSGVVTKDELAATLRAYQVSVDETKSDARDAANKYVEYEKAGREDKIQELLESLRSKGGRTPT